MTHPVDLGPPVPTKKPRISFVCDEELKTDLEIWAEEESRTVSNLCELIIKQAIKQRQESKKEASDQS